MSPAIAVLHGFGQRYDLPISLSLYLFAAAGVVVLSFVMVVVLAGDRFGAEAVAYPRRRLPWLDAAANSRIPRLAGGLIGLAALTAVIVTGWFGSPRPFYNPAEYIVWVYFWAGTVILSGLIGNLWALLSPFAAIGAALSRLRPGPPPARLPAAIGIWPAVVAYFLFAVLELASGLANRPALLASVALAYALLTVLGMAAFGPETWLFRAEAFTVLFEIVARFAPIESERDPDGVVRVWLRPLGAGLLRGDEPGGDRVVFIVLMLSTLAFDGILATPVYRGYETVFGPAFALLGAVGLPLLKTAGIVVLTSAFLAAFVIIMRLVMWFGWPDIGPLLGRWRGYPTARAMSAFALTLVPIALVYNAAHNYTYVVLQSQGLIPLLADPLQRGWHLLPTTGYRISFLLAGAAVVWYVQLVLIVVGHVIAVYLAHLRAGERFHSASRVLLSQYPMLVLMVLYTMTSLWILAQPITREA
ncbi:MAG: hypothetical protein NVS9B1_08660 [Candidatus Dormibacteraceae bacterium]